MRLETTSYIAKVIGALYALSMTTVFVITWFVIYLSPTQSIILHVNHFGEADIELLVNVVGFPCSVYYLLIEIKRMVVG